jgi:hypothetical protein
MPDCTFRQTDAESLVCEHCGRPLRLRGAVRLPLRRKCLAADAPARSEDESEALMQLCRSNACGGFDAVRDACRRSGCASTRREAWLARLRRGACPAGKW